MKYMITEKPLVKIIVLKFIIKIKKIIKLSPKPIVVYNLTFRVKMKFDTNKENEQFSRHLNGLLVCKETI